jgi:hypothetical protein
MTRNTEEDMSFMGTMEDAQKKFLAAYDDNCKYGGPIVGVAKTIKEWEANRRESNNRFMTASRLLAWHMERVILAPAPKVKVTDEMVCRAIEAMTNPIVECCDCYVCKESMRAALEAALGEK